MLLKIYTRTRNGSDLAVGTESSYEPEMLHLIEDAKDVVIHSGNWGLPPDYESSPAILPFGPNPPYDRAELFGAKSNDCLKLVDYTISGERIRATINNLCYVCNDTGKTIERVKALD